jgi:threonine/homoserine/homoserine lactone efflux protein
MPSAVSLGLFAVAAIALLVLPGPAVLYITTRSAAQGRKAGMVSVLGVHTGTLVHVLAAVAGLSALLVTSALAFSVVKVVGAAYLIVLGVRTIAGRRDAFANTPDGAARVRSLKRLYVDGVVVNVLNPKTALFFLAFLPQFVERDHGRPVWLQTLVLGAVFVALGLVSDGLYAMAGAGVGRWLRNRGWVRRRGPIVEGGILVGLGVAALAVPHRKVSS